MFIHSASHVQVAQCCDDVRPINNPRESLPFEMGTTFVDDDDDDDDDLEA